MTSTLLRPALVSLLLLAACSAEGPRAEPAQAEAPPADTPQVAPSLPSAPVDERTLGAEGAGAVLIAYYGMIARRAFDLAYLVWTDEGRASGQTLAEFAAGFNETLDASVELGTPGRIEGAAGSRYIEIPVVIRARSMSGPQRFEGSYTLRRSVVDGATRAQRSWRIASADVREAPAR